jgi:hypothetical protein
MTFTFPAARDNYTDIVLRGISHLPSVQVLADAAAERMRELNDGRMWMAGHWRRGDCMLLSPLDHFYRPVLIGVLLVVRLHWNKGTPMEAIGHILSRFEEGTERLRRFRDAEGFRPPPVPGVELDQSFNNASLPLPGDRYASVSLCRFAKNCCDTSLPRS